MAELEGFNQDKLKPAPASDVEVSRRELLNRFSPFGKLKLDTAQCTACGLCALECPTGALTFSLGEVTDTFQLLFKHGSCVACGQCVEVCPEKCLHMERLLELDSMDTQSILLEGQVVRCSRCGSHVGPKVMIDKLRARVEASGSSSTSQFELCPACKVQTQFDSLSVENGHIT